MSKHPLLNQVQNSTITQKTSLGFQKNWKHKQPWKFPSCRTKFLFFLGRKTFQFPNPNVTNTCDFEDSGYPFIHHLHHSSYFVNLVRNCRPISLLRSAHRQRQKPYEALGERVGVFSDPKWGAKNQYHRVANQKPTKPQPSCQKNRLQLNRHALSLGGGRMRPPTELCGGQRCLW